MAVVAMGGIIHESNSFSSLPTQDDAFSENGVYGKILRRDELFALEKYNNCLGGFSQTMRSQGHQVKPLLYTEAFPSAPVFQSTFDKLLNELLANIKCSLPVDAVYLDLHGAMLSDNFDDADGELISAVRKIVGPETLIVVTVDLHANITQIMIDESDLLLPYRTYPHVDMYMLGEEMALECSQLISNKSKLCKAIRHLDFMFPVNRQTTLDGPMLALIEKAKSLRTDEVLRIEITAGFQPCDIELPVPCVFGFGSSQTAVETAVNALYEYANTLSPDFDFDYLTPEQAINKADKLPKPVVFADAQDNPGGGGSGDTMFIARALSTSNVGPVLYGPVCDPQAATLFYNAGKGASVQASLGGHTVNGDSPLTALYEVHEVSNRPMVPSGDMLSGQEIDLGLSALVKFNDIQFVVTSKRHQGLDRGFFTHFGCDLSKANIIVVKSAVHFRAEFDQICGARIDVIAPGFEIMDFASLPYSRLRTGVRYSGTQT